MAILIFIIVLASTLVSIDWYLTNPHTNIQQNQKPFYFGVSFNGNTTQQAKVLIDRVKNFTNLFVEQSGPVSANETALNEIVDYAVASKLDVMVAFGFFNRSYTWQIPWLDYADQQWGSHFLGVYLHDEPGGVEIDTNKTGILQFLSIRKTNSYYQHQPAIDLAINGSLPPDNYELSQAAYHFVSGLQTDRDLNELKNRSIHSFTSDYALYWFDYLGGYDTVFAELGSNQSTTQIIDTVRGAANIQGKTWGTILTWTYFQPPYLVNATEMYNQLMTSYSAGAKYEIIFDYPQIADNPYGVLTNDQFNAMQRFWNNIQTLQTKPQGEVALVLPANFGWGMRNPQDSIWGFWRPNATPEIAATSSQVWNNLQKLVAQYGTNLDVVYDDSRYPVRNRGYVQIIYWNQTV